MREKLLKLLTLLAMRHRRAVFAVSLILTLGLGAACGLIKLDTRWSALLPESMPVVKEFKKIDDNFLQPGNMIIAISGDDPVLLEKITDEATGILQEKLVCRKGSTLEECKTEGRYARYVYGKMPEDWLTDHALQLAKPKDVERVYNILKDPRLLPYLTHLNDDLEAEYTDSENVKNQERQIVASLDAVQELLGAIGSAVGESVSEEEIARVVRDLTIGRPYFFSLDNSMSLITVASAIPSNDFETMPLIDKRIEKLLAPLGEKYPDYRIERTGLTAVGRDEMDSVGPQTYLISLIALVLVFLLLIWNFRSALTPVISLIPIVVGIIWTMGIIGLTLGTLNLITVMIMVVLIGLGIDFSIHIANRFHEEIAAQKSIEESLRLAIGRTGVGVVTGAVTTAVAFLALMIADTKAIRQFGFCSGIGVLTTLIAVMLILPALLAYRAMRQSRKADSGKPVRKAYEFRMLGSIAEFMGRRRKIVIPVSIAVTLMGIWAGINLQWEYNWLNLEPKGLRSVELQDEIIEKFRLSVSMSMLTAESVEESRLLRKKLKEKSLVGDVDDISQWLSRPDFDESKEYIQMLRKALTEDKELSRFAESDRAKLAEELDRLWANIVEIQALSIIGGQDRVVEKTRQIVASRNDRETGFLWQLVRRFESGNSIDWEDFNSFSQAFDRKLREKAVYMTRSVGPVTLSMMPEDIRAMYTSATAPGYLMNIYPKDNIYERDKLELFQNAVASVRPNVTGTSQLILNMVLQTMQEGKIACLAAVIVIFVVLLIDFRRPLLAGLSLLPLVSGMAFMLGVLWLLGQKLNYINMIALPVIIGIGVDDGVHFFHRYIQEGKDGLGRAVTSVGRAMLMTSLTTMIGFGSLMLYLMRGMASLGVALFIGVGGCFLFTIILLPAFAKVFERRIFKEETQGGLDDA